MSARPSTDRRRRAELSGRIAEWGAAILITLKGFAILARRYRVPAGEVDLIARRGRLLVFVEVKARAELDAAIEAVTPRSRHRISAAAKAFLSRHAHLADSEVRYDIIVFAGWRMRHLPDAWRDEF
ncbi:YraN family protein [Hyphococcus flavus]|uniref:UPF0102 protein PUV54_06660 n=1 Tax=Hyphococcus flavus TaxID=1866326 RepID=A0AAF0CII0_9PROT|nr:YraN family protein [Hyphococcus flavus]WDI32877.1 YraN family protein [Hyphococcus flavus]